MRILLRRWGLGCCQGEDNGCESGEIGVLNIGGEEAVTINELAGVVIELCGKNLEMVHVEPSGYKAFAGKHRESEKDRL